MALSPKAAKLPGPRLFLEVVRRALIQSPDNSVRTSISHTMLLFGGIALKMLAHWRCYSNPPPCRSGHAFPNVLALGHAKAPNCQYLKDSLSLDIQLAASYTLYRTPVISACFFAHQTRRTGVGEPLRWVYTCAQRAVQRDAVSADPVCGYASLWKRSQVMDLFRTARLLGLCIATMTPFPLMFIGVAYTQCSREQQHEVRICCT